MLRCSKRVRSRNSALRARAVEMLVDDVHPQQLRAGEQPREPVRDLAGPAAAVENPRRGWQLIPREQRRFLWPDRFRLRRERADHRLVRHLARLRIQPVGRRHVSSIATIVFRYARSGANRRRCAANESSTGLSR